MELKTNKLISVTLVKENGDEVDFLINLISSPSSASIEVKNSSGSKIFNLTDFILNGETCCKLRSENDYLKERIMYLEGELFSYEDFLNIK